MTTFEDTFNDNITALMDPLFCDTWVAEDGTEFLGQWTLFRTEDVPERPGLASEWVAELRWQESSFAAPSPEYKFKRKVKGDYWRMRAEPEVTGGEIIATIYQTKRSKTGAI